MFTELQVVGNLDLLQIGQMIASLAFGEARPQDQEWVFRRYREMYDRLQETPLYKEMVRLATEKATEKARAEALKEAEEARKKDLRETLVQARFPKLTDLTTHLARTIDQSSTLQTLILKISTASSLKEARQHLFKVIEEENSQD